LEYAGWGTVLSELLQNVQCNGGDDDLAQVNTRVDSYVFGQRDHLHLDDLAPYQLASAKRLWGWLPL
jgi:hypothetical protein